MDDTSQQFIPSKIKDSLRKERPTLKKLILPYLILVMTLSSCSLPEIDIEEMELDLLVDEWLVKIVDMLLENDGSSPGSPGKPGNSAPTAPSTSIAVTPYYYNDEQPNHNFLFQTIERTAVSGGMELRGALLEEAVLDQETYDRALVEEDFTISLYRFSGSATRVEETLLCTVSDRRDSVIYCSYEDSAGETHELSVDDWGRVKIADGTPLYKQIRFVCLKTTDITSYVSAEGESYGNQIPTENFSAEVTVVSSRVTSFYLLP